MVDLSIIIVNYQSLKYIDRLIASITKSKTKKNFEIIVVNNDHDLTNFSEFEEQNPGVICIQNSGNWGFANGCNIGAKVSSGKIMLFLNPDTEICNPKTIDHMVDVLESNSRIGILSCNLLDKKNQELKKDQIYRSNNPWYFFRFLDKLRNLFFNENKNNISSIPGVIYVEYVIGAVLMIRSKDFRKVDGWNDQKFWMYFEDNDICNKVTKKLNKKIAFIKDLKIYHLGGGASDGINFMKIEMLKSRYIYLFNNSYKLPNYSIALISIGLIIKDFFIPLVRLCFNTLIFNKVKMRKYSFHLKHVFNYYTESIRSFSWNNHRLKRDSMNDA